MAKKTVKQNAIAAALSAYDTADLQAVKAKAVKSAIDIRSKRSAPVISNKGRFPYAVLHKQKTEGFKAAFEYAKTFSNMSDVEAIQYVNDVVRTSGQPHLVDLFEREEEEKSLRRQRQQFQNVDMEA